MGYKGLQKEERWIIIGILPIFIVGALFHFLFEISGKNLIVGAVAAVNESIWEHLKLLLLPIILWWGIYYLIKGKANHISIDRWFFATLCTLVFGIFFIPVFYYTYTGAFGIESLVLDILSLFLAIIFGQLLGLFLYRRTKGINAYISILAIVLLLVIFAVFTYFPPHIPLFKDGDTGQYGIGYNELMRF